MEKSAKWSTVFNIFDPYEPLSGSKLKACFVEREDSPLPNLEFRLRPEHLEQKVLLVGQRGCGKTSELFKLISEIQGDYFTVYVDLYGSLDLKMTSRIELLFCIGTAVYKAAKDAGFEPPKCLWEELISSLSTLVREQTRQSNFSIDPAAALQSVLCTAGTVVPSLAAAGQAIGESIRFGFGVGRKEIEQLELEPVLREVIKRVNAIIEAVGKSAAQPVLLVADGLDKIEDEDQAAFIFGRSWVLRAIRGQAVYTVPIVLYYSPAFQGVRNQFSCEELPNVRLYTKGEREKPNAPGIETMQAVVERRLKAAGMDLEHVFAPEGLQLLIRMSGGLMRDMVSLVRQAAIKAGQTNQDRIDLQCAQDVVSKVRREWEAALYKEHYSSLERIERSGGLVEEGDPVGMELLRNRYVVSYENGGFWRDIHPIVLRILGDYRAQERLTQFKDSSKDNPTL